MKRIIIFFILFLINISAWGASANPTESTALGTISTTSQQLRCYGNISTNAPGDTAGYWDCSGGGNQDYICPDGTVTRGFTTWLYTHWWGDEYRCYLQCATVYLGSSQCDWK